MNFIFLGGGGGAVSVLWMLKAAMYDSSVLIFSLVEYVIVFYVRMLLWGYKMVYDPT